MPLLLPGFAREWVCICCSHPSRKIKSAARMGHPDLWFAGLLADGESSAAEVEVRIGFGIECEVGAGVFGEGLVLAGLSVDEELAVEVLARKGNE